MDTHISTSPKCVSRLLSSLLLTVIIYLAKFIAILRHPTLFFLSFVDAAFCLLLTYYFPQLIWNIIKVAVFGALGHLVYGLWALRWFDQYVEERLPLFRLAGWEITVKNGTKYLEGSEGFVKTLEQMARAFVKGVDIVAWASLKSVDIVARSLKSYVGKMWVGLEIEENAVRLVEFLGKKTMGDKKEKRKGKVVVYSGVAGDLAGLEGTESIEIREDLLKGD